MQAKSQLRRNSCLLSQKITFFNPFMCDVVVYHYKKRKPVHRLSGICNTPGIHAERYIVLIFPFIRSYFVEFTSKSSVKVSRREYVSPVTQQKIFIFEP